MKRISNILSYLFHPLLIPTWMVLLLVYSNPYLFAGQPVKILVLNVFFQTFAMPFIAIAMAVKLKLVGSIEMESNKQRIVPLIITIIFYMWFYQVAKAAHYPVVYNVFILGADISLCLAFFINVFRKLSLHMVGMSGALVAMMFWLLLSQTDISYIFLLMVVLTGAVATARMYLGAHTLQEIYSGFVIGMFGQVLGLYLYH